MKRRKFSGHEASVKRRRQLADSVKDEPFTEEDRRVMGDPVDEWDRVQYLVLRKAGMGITEEELAKISGPPRGRGRPQKIPPFNRRASERAAEECRRSNGRLAYLLLRIMMLGKDETDLKRAAYRAARDGGDVRAVVGRELWKMLKPGIRGLLDALPDSDVAKAFGVDARTLRRWRGRKVRQHADPTRARKPKDLAAPDAEAE